MVSAQTYTKTPSMIKKNVDFLRISVEIDDPCLEKKLVVDFANQFSTWSTEGTVRYYIRSFAITFE